MGKGGTAYKVRGEIFEWRGPAPFYFLRISKEISDEIKSQSKGLSYGWGVIPAYGKVGKTDFETALFPKDGAYLIPLKDSLRQKEGLEPGDIATVFLNVGKRLKS